VNILSDVETRVLGSLVEKELTTPEYYPLSLNALVNACNQKSNRDPVTTLNENAVSQALRRLDKEGLAGPADAIDNRVTKFEHELRSRAERMHRFDDLGQVQSTLQRLAQREPPVVKILPRRPGTKEARYAHLLSGDVQIEAPEAAPEAAVTHRTADGERIARLENEVTILQDEVAILKQQLAAFRKQFE
jgi:uncharacterized protein YceH (UPF0502 family)